MSIKKEIEKILDVSYRAPHVPPDGKTFKDIRCGDCFCTIQMRHTHSQNIEYVKPLLELLKPLTK